MREATNVLQLLLILGSISLVITAENNSTSFLPHNCINKCGNISIHYPFGIGYGCFRATGFNLTCDETDSTPKLLLGDKDTVIEVLQINTTRGVVIIKSPIITMDKDAEYNKTSLIDLKGWPYSFSLYSFYNGALSPVTYNVIYTMGCSAIVYLMDSTDTILSSCLTMCSSNISNKADYAEFGNGQYCIIYVDDTNVTSLRIQLTRFNQKELDLINTSGIEVIMFDNAFNDYPNITEVKAKKNSTEVGAALAWYINDGHLTCEEAIKNKSTYACLSPNSKCYDTFSSIGYDTFSSIGYSCQCSDNYQGNPYLPDGCPSPDEYPVRLRPDKGCSETCGNITIPFPFGLTINCSRDKSFVLNCTKVSNTPTPLFQRQLIVTGISLEEGQFEVTMLNTSFSVDFDYSRDHSKFHDVKTTYRWILTEQLCEDAKKNKTTFACLAEQSICQNIASQGYQCKCKEGYTGNPYLTNGCRDIDECKEPSKYICYGNCKNVEGDYICTCPAGSYGNPKTKACIPNPPEPKKSTLLLGIVVGITGGMGLLILCAIFFILRSKFRKRHQEKMREKYFYQNHGLLLKQLVSSGEDVAERTKIFSLEEVEKATNSFDKTRVLGCGGHGTVYKGILLDQRVVAIKKSKTVKKSEIDQFINEVAILCQINHRHVVRLFGCCLETEVPLLIYEFISNGALSDHLHISNGNSTLSWEDRLRIAAEAAGALAYLHSAASISILHRDVKSSNILLDDHFTAKVLDFGASRFIPLDQTHISTGIQGTFGYLDPEYYQTSQLTQKSDVYSFGVILLELLTGKKPIYTTEDEQDLNLSMHFLQAIRSNRSFDLMEDRIIKESNEEELNEMVQLVQMCLELKGVDRPTMKEVEYKLQSLRKIRMKKKGHYIAKGDKEIEYLLNATSYVSCDGTSRNYSMEKEVMWSQHYPR